MEWARLNLRAAADCNASVGGNGAVASTDEADWAVADAEWTFAGILYAAGDYREIAMAGTVVYVGPVTLRAVGCGCWTWK